MKHVLLMLGLVLGLLGTPAFAKEASVGEVKLELIQKMETDGYLSGKLADEARQKYVTEADLKTVAGNAPPAADKPSLWERYVSWQNFFKVLGVVLFLVAFGGWIAKLAGMALWLIVAVPKEVYQALFLAATIPGTLVPHLIWASQSFYIALFSAFANLVVLGWVVESHPRLAEALKKLFNLGLPMMSVMSFWLMLYFGALAIGYQSELFGFFAAVALSGLFTFGVYYRPGVLMLDFDDKAMPAVVFGHLLVLASYCVAQVAGVLPAQAKLFEVGLQYYCTIAMGVGFLVAASPFGWRNKGNPGAFLALFLFVAAAAVYGYFFYDLKVIGSIVLVFGALLFLEWVGYLSYKTGFLFGTFAMGAVLYGFSLLLERYSHLIILKLA